MDSGPPGQHFHMGPPAGAGAGAGWGGGDFECRC